VLSAAARSCPAVLATVTFRAITTRAGDFKRISGLVRIEIIRAPVLPVRPNRVKTVYGPRSSHPSTRDAMRVTPTE